MPSWRLDVLRLPSLFHPSSRSSTLVTVTQSLGCVPAYGEASMIEPKSFLKVIGQRVIICQPLGDPDAPADCVEVELTPQLVVQLAALLPALGYRSS